MKKVLFSIVVMMCASLSFVQAQTSNVAPSIEWKTKVHDFGSIDRGKPVTAVFEFTNNTGKPVVISDVVTSCGCTKGEYPKEPVAPGATANVSAIYNAASVGVFNKSVTVKFSDTQDAVLSIKGMVKS